MVLEEIQIANLNVFENYMLFLSGVVASDVFNLYGSG